MYSDFRLWVARFRGMTLQVVVSRSGVSREAGFMNIRRDLDIKYRSLKGAGIFLNIPNYFAKIFGDGIPQSQKIQ
jgi:hypothetical protein